MTLRLNGSTSGYVEIDAPAVAGTSVLTLPTGTGTLLKAEGGKVLQVMSATKVDMFSTTSTSFVDATGLSVSVTPSSATSTILVSVSVALAHSTTDTNNTKARLMRNSTPINTNVNGITFVHYGSMSDYDSLTYSVSFLDSPATTLSTIYKLQISSSAGTGYINRSRLTTDTGTSSITIMEISA